MKRIALLFMMMFLLTSCSPKMSATMTVRVNDLLKEGAVLNAMTDQGVNYINFSQQLAKTTGAYNLLVAEWPEKYKPEAKAYFDKAFTGWKLAGILWNYKVNNSDTPTEPDVNNFVAFNAYGGSKLVTKQYTDAMIVPKYRGMKYVPFENLPVLLTMASENYQKAVEIIQEDMK
jgi:hypothetical protein